ncbi:MAG TPA: hypothetical protein VN893_23395 [Bryobacteraceae bacterium]|nr:hypothetical protein [Bryobacteraceae bacterium]
MDSIAKRNGLGVLPDLRVRRKRDPLGGAREHVCVELLYRPKKAGAVAGCTGCCALVDTNNTVAANARL